MSDVDPGSYVEVQMDRQTVVLAAVGFGVLLVVSFLVGRWTAPGSPEPAAPGVAAAGAGDAGLPAEGPAEEAVDGEPMFGDRVVSAAGAPPIGPVPAGTTQAASPPGPASNPPASRPAAQAPARSASSGTPPAETQRSRPAASTQPSAPATAAKPSPTADEEASPAGASGGWVIQVAAVKDATEARALQRRLEGKGYTVRVVEEGGYQKVQVGPFGRKSEAQVAERRLKRDEKLATWLKAL